MIIETQRRGRFLRPTALLLVASLAAPVLVGCGGPNNSGANQPPIDESRGGRISYQEPTPPKQGMSTTKKLVLLAGAAALYYMWKKHRDAQNNPAQYQYYLSKNGRVYYRDNTGRVHWVTPPTQGLMVPYDEAQEYSRYRGYNNQTDGEDFGALSGAN